MTETIFKPKKRIFMALTSISALVGAVMVYIVWKVTVPGLAQIHRYLPAIFGIFSMAIVFALMTGVVGIVMALLGIPIMRLSIFGLGRRLISCFPLR